MPKERLAFQTCYLIRNLQILLSKLFAGHQFCSVMPGKGTEENVNNHVIINSIWHIFARKLNCDHMICGKSKSPVSRCRSIIQHLVYWANLPGGSAGKLSGELHQVNPVQDNINIPMYTLHVYVLAPVHLTEESGTCYNCTCVKYRDGGSLYSTLK